MAMAMAMELTCQAQECLYTNVFPDGNLPVAQIDVKLWYSRYWQQQGVLGVEMMDVCMDDHLDQLRPPNLLITIVFSLQGGY